MDAATPPPSAQQLADDQPARSRTNVESFNLDHRAVAAPYVRVADRKVLPLGDELTKIDVRFCQPNSEHLEMPVVHSLEHLVAEHMRNHTDAVIDFSPMGCQTGFYLLLAGRWQVPEVADLLEATLNDLLSASEVPAANEVQCGWGANHTLGGAQQAARKFLDSRGTWEQVMA
jgi:S-ribosylhomocysteine lyase